MTIRELINALNKRKNRSMTALTESELLTILEKLTMAQHLQDAFITADLWGDHYGCGIKGYRCISCYYKESADKELIEFVRDRDPNYKRAKPPAFKWETGKSYKTTGGHRACIKGERPDEDGSVLLVVTHYLFRKGKEVELGRWFHSKTGDCLNSNFAPYYNLTEEEWSE